MDYYKITLANTPRILFAHHYQTSGYAMHLKIRRQFYGGLLCRAGIYTKPAGRRNLPLHSRGEALHLHEKTGRMV